MPRQLRLRLLASIFALALPIAKTSAASAPAFLAYKPIATISVTRLDELLPETAPEEALSGTTNRCDRDAAGAIVRRALFLPALDGIDRSSPVFKFYLTADPPGSLPIPVCRIPVEKGQEARVREGFAKVYAASAGGALRCYSSPSMKGLPLSLYVVIVEGHLLVSPSLEGLQWIAIKSRDKTIPRPTSFRDGALSASIDTELAARLGRSAPPLPSDEAPPPSAIPGDPSLLQELSVFCSTLSAVDLVLSRDGACWNLSLRLTYPPASPLALAMDALEEPSRDWMDLFPPSSANQSVSPMATLVKNLPLSNRLFLSDLAGKSQLIGFHLLPSAPDADDHLFPLLTGDSAFTFISDARDKFVGSVGFYGLAAPSQALAYLKRYFKGSGAASRNKAIQDPSLRQSHGNPVFAYDVVPPRNENRTAIERTALVLTSLIDMDHVEVGIAGDRLIVARGKHGLIDRWMAGKGLSGQLQPLRPLGPAIPLASGERLLGCGRLEPVKVVRGIFDFLPDFASAYRKVPAIDHGGAWRMTRSSEAVTFDFSLADQEIPCLQTLHALNEEYKDEFLTRFLMQQVDKGNSGPSR